MAVSRIEFDSKAVEKFLRSKRVQDEIGRRAANVARAAGPGFRSEVDQGYDRARAVVWTGTYEARRAEHYDRALTRAIDAGRQ